jgi:LPS-assembly protein
MVETYGEGEWDYDDTQNRFYVDFQTEVATTLERDFFTDSQSGESLRHQLRPYVEYQYIPDVDQAELPQFDDVDTILEQNTITYGVDNFFNHVNKTEGGIDSLADYAEFTIEQSYNISESDEPFSDVFAKLKWFPMSMTSLIYKTYYDTYNSDFTAHTIEGVYQNSRGDFFTIDYSYKEENDIDQINGSIGTTIFDSWLVKGEVEHSLSTDETVLAKGSLTYQALCWSVKFQTTYRPDDTTYFLVFNLANIGIPLGVDF